MYVGNEVRDGVERVAVPGTYVGGYRQRMCTFTMTACDSHSNLGPHRAMLTKFFSLQITTTAGNRDENVRRQRRSGTN